MHELVNYKSIKSIHKHEKCFILQASSFRKPEKISNNYKNHSGFAINGFAHHNASRTILLTIGRAIHQSRTNAPHRPIFAD